MLSIFKKFIRSLAEKPDIWFFYAFLATSTLSVRKVLFFYPTNGSFNEYTGIYIYLSDIFLFLTIIAWLFILCNKYINLSTLNSVFLAFHKKCSTPVQMFHVEHSMGQAWNILSNNKTIKNVPRGTFFWLKKTYPQIVHNYVIIFPLLLVIFSFLSIQWSTNHQIAFFRSIKIFEFVTLYFFILYNVSRLPRRSKLFHVEQFACFWGGTFLKRFFQIIIAVSLIQSIIGICQFIIQRSVGLLWLKESIISPQVAGVAKVIFDGHTYIRAYGLFPHPNILGGFLVLSVILTLIYFKMFHSGTIQCSTWNILHGSHETQNVPRGTFGIEWNTLMRLILIIQSVALFLTFSKSAIIGLSIAFFYLFIKKCSSPSIHNFPSQYKCSTWKIIRGTRGTLPSWTNTIKMFHVEHFYRKLFLIIGIIILLFFVLKPDTYSLLFKSFDEREFYLNVSRGTFLSNPFFGIGSGQFVVSMQKIAGVQQWQFQPVHNVFLLIINELGLFVLFAFLFFIFKLFSECPIGMKCSTWNILHESHEAQNISLLYCAPKMFHPNTNVPRGTLYGAGVEHFCNLQNRTFSKEHTINTSIYLKCLLLAFFFIMLFDHYFWDIHQGQILLWLLFGLLAGNNKIKIDTIDKL